MRHHSVHNIANLRHTVLKRAEHRILVARILRSNTLHECAFLLGANHTLRLHRLRKTCLHFAAKLARRQHQQNELISLSANINICFVASAIINGDCLWLQNRTIASVESAHTAICLPVSVHLVNAAFVADNAPLLDLMHLAQKTLGSFTSTPRDTVAHVHSFVHQITTVSERFIDKVRIVQTKRIGLDTARIDLERDIQRFLRQFHLRLLLVLLVVIVVVRCVRRWRRFCWLLLGRFLLR
mmetsp:Transcript_32298/g.52284  ORF Transcript_32298/g.52284 Transcript_32298/m.52284 type:complete len:240 (-) Transcript_32298:652-1371(-)